MPSGFDVTEHGQRGQCERKGKTGQAAGPGIVVVPLSCCPVVPLPVALALAVVKALALAVVVLFMALARAPFTQCRLFVKFIK